MTDIPQDKLEKLAKLRDHIEQNIFIPRFVDSFNVLAKKANIQTITSEEDVVDALNIVSHVQHLKQAHAENNNQIKQASAMIRQAWGQTEDPVSKDYSSFQGEFQKLAKQDTELLNLVRSIVSE